MLILGLLPGCNQIKRLTGRGKPAAQDGGPAEVASADKGEHGKDEHAPKGEQKDEHGDKGEHGKEAHASAEVDGGHESDGGREGEDVEAEYTPRRLTIDEEDCDDVTRDALAQLRKQAEELSAQKQALAEREQALKAKVEAQEKAAAQVEERIKELSKLAADVDERVARAGRPASADPARLAAQRAQRKERVDKVAKMVSGMTAQRAATLLGEFQDDDLAVEVLQSLPQEAAGKVLGQMRPSSAARLAERLGAGEREGARP